MGYKNFLEFAKSRHTTYEYSDKLVSESNVLKILEAARWSPSCDNLQPWHFIVVKNKKKIEKIMSTMSFGEFHNLPPLLIAVVLRKSLCEQSGHRCSIDKNIGIIDGVLCVAMASITLVYEAQDLGVDSSFMTPNHEKANKILGVTDGNTISLVVGLGYEKKGAYKPKRIRKSLNEVVSYQ